MSKFKSADELRDYLEKRNKDNRYTITEDSPSRNKKKERKDINEDNGEEPQPHGYVDQD